MEKPLVSIIVPCYNQGQYLAEALDSVLAQTYLDWECIIVDDGSTDNSKEVAYSYSAKDSRFKYIYQENQGPSVARNNAIQNSIGTYILPLDGDDKIHKDYVAQAVDVLEKRKDVKIVYCRVEYFGEKSGEWNMPEFDVEKMLLYNLIFCTAMYRRSDFNQTIGYNPNMKEGLEDWDFWLSLLESGGLVYKIPKTYFFYRIKEDSRNKEFLQRGVLESLLKKIVQNHPSLYRQQYQSLYNRLDNFRTSRFYNVFNWLRYKEYQWEYLKSQLVSLFPKGNKDSRVK